MITARKLLVISLFSVLSCSLLASQEEMSSSPSKISKVGKKIERLLAKGNKKRCKEEISSALSQEEEAKVLSEIYYSRNLTDKQKELVFIASEVIREAQDSAD
jgi:hypothetical protein